MQQLRRSALGVLCQDSNLRRKWCSSNSVARSNSSLKLQILHPWLTCHLKPPSLLSKLCRSLNNKPYRLARKSKMAKSPLNLGRQQRVLPLQVKAWRKQLNLQFPMKNCHLEVVRAQAVVTILPTKRALRVVVTQRQVKSSKRTNWRQLHITRRTPKLNSLKPNPQAPKSLKDRLKELSRRRHRTISSRTMPEIRNFWR